MAKRRSLQEKLEIIQTAEKQGVTATLRQYNVASALFYRWKAAYDLNGVEGLKGKKDEARSQELKHLEKENLQLKKLLAEKTLELEMKEELLKKTLQRQKTK